MPRNIGRRRKIPLKDLRVGYRILDPIRGAHGKILLHVGEILSKRHVDWLLGLEQRPGAGRLSLYTREVWVVNTDASGDEYPQVEQDPYKSIVCRDYKRGNPYWIPRA